MKPLAVLGVTGSIGRQTLEVARELAWPVTAIGARRPSAELAQIARDWPEATIAVAGGSQEERAEFADEFGNRVSFGSESLAEAAAQPDVLVVNGVVGLAGLPVTLAAARAGNRIALANKESMVAAGPMIKAELARSGGELIPVDSEHSAIFQCLAGERPETVSKVILTASGGPFRGFSRDQLESVTPEQALRHPNWSMGKRITVDSATLVNKALEVIEAINLFDLDLEHVEVVVHPESVVHSLVRFRDGSIKAQLGAPDMRLPIAVALTYPDRATQILEPFELAGVTLHFEAPDREAFKALDLGYEAARQGGAAPAIFNAADEVAVEAFLGGRVGFNGITEVISSTMEKLPGLPADTLEEVLAADRAAREEAAGLIAGAC